MFQTRWEKEKLTNPSIDQLCTVYISLRSVGFQLIIGHCSPLMREYTILMLSLDHTLRVITSHNLANPVLILVDVISTLFKGEISFAWTWTVNNVNRNIHRCLYIERNFITIIWYNNINNYLW